MAAGTPGDRAVALAGYEDHSLDLVGDDNVLSYDDSNVFVRRTGELNANTGDTDTSGLNVVDARSSDVRSGASGSSDEPVDASPFGHPAGQPAAMAPVVGGLGRGPSVSVSDINGTSTATAADSLVVGGDGMDDNGVHVRGNRNVAVYDD
jgi:hypothetical protein